MSCPTSSGEHGATQPAQLIANLSPEVAEARLCLLHIPQHGYFKGLQLNKLKPLEIKAAGYFRAFKWLICYQL